jgi:hypothetical protein
VDIDTGKFWISDAAATDEELHKDEQKGYSLPKDVRILDIEFPLKGKISAGQVKINFYPADYSTRP